ncbi:MAG: hypothetical protein WAU07_01220 [Microgenomates group bacterium]
MRRREKFVIAAVFLSIGLLGVQAITLDYRYLAVGIFTVITYLVSTWALSDDLQKHERITIVPFPSMYATAVSVFYFLLPSHMASKIAILFLFGVGMYGLFLTSNIFSVAKGRTIQLLHAAHAVGLLFTLLTSLLLSHTIFSLRFGFYWNALLIGLVHFPLIFMSVWSVNLEANLKKNDVIISLLLTTILMQIALVLSFFPFTIWYYALFIMSVLYLGLGVLHNLLKGRLFSKTLTEYSLVAGFIVVIFLVIFPLK